MDQDEAVALSVGSIVGGESPAGRAWYDAIRELQRRVASACGDARGTVNLNVVFHVPGPLLSPSYDGVRTGRFRRRDSHLMIQVAVPVDLPDDPPAALGEMLFASIAAAEAWATKRNIANRLDVARAIARSATSDA